MLELIIINRYAENANDFTVVLSVDNTIVAFSKNNIRKLLITALSIGRFMFCANAPKGFK